MDIIVLDKIPVVFEKEKLAKKLHISEEGEDYGDLVKLIGEAEAIARPKALYGEVYIDEKGDDSISAGGFIFKSRVLRKNLDEVYKFFPYMATCGVELEKWSEGISDILHRFWADTIKETVLRAAVETQRKHFTEKFKIHKFSSMNPGSLEDWPITEQKKLFSLVGDVEERIGLKLTESSLMLPVKSLSGILFANETGFVNCQLCRRERCIGRRAAYNQASL